MSDLLSRFDQAPAFALGLGAAAIATVTILTALAFEHWGGYPPCPLCLQQRYAYYAGIPAVLAALWLLSLRWTWLAALLLALVAVAFLANAGLGAYQAGAEWGLWPGPDSCAATQEIATRAQDLLKGLSDTRVVRCDEAAWRFGGLSFAGWNGVISALLAVLTAAAARLALRRA